MPDGADGLALGDVGGEIADDLGRVRGRRIGLAELRQLQEGGHRRAQRSRRQARRNSTMPCRAFWYAGLRLTWRRSRGRASPTSIAGPSTAPGPGVMG